MYFVEVSGELLKKGTIGVCRGCGASLFKLVKDVNINSVTFEDIWDMQRKEKASFGFDKCEHCSNSPNIMYMEEVKEPIESSAKGFCETLRNIVGVGIDIDEATAMNSQLKKTILGKLKDTEKVAKNEHHLEIGYDKAFTDQMTAYGYVAQFAKTTVPLCAKDIIAVMVAYEKYKLEKFKFEKGV